METDISLFKFIKISKSTNFTIMSNIFIKCRGLHCSLVSCCRWRI